MRAKIRRISQDRYRLKKARLRGLFWVELAGIEPASKQGSRGLSTCLVTHYFSSAGRGGTRYRSLRRLDFQNSRAPRPFLFLHFQHPLIGLRRSGIPGDVLLPHLVRDKLNLQTAD